MSAEWKIPLENVVPFPQQKEKFDIEEALEFQRYIFLAQEKLPIYYKFKVVFETIAAAALLVLLSIPMTLIALAIRIRMGSPIIYKQLRVGKNAKPFWAYKFRTMHNNVPRVVDMGYKPLEKVVEDPRVEGRLGSFLRKWKWDELPQLWNVVKGDMLLIGPRPYMYHENFYFTKRQCVRFAVRPGISGLWQTDSTINDPNKKANLDFYYVKKLNLLLDLFIWTRTLHFLSFVGEKIKTSK